MTLELIAVIKKIDLALNYYFEKNRKIKSASAILDMAYSDYQDKKNNTYTIIIIGESLTLEDLLNIDDFLNKIIDKLESSRIKITLLPITESELNYKSLNLNIKMYTKEQFENLITATLKHQIGKRNRLLYGENYLKNYQDMEITKDMLLKDINVYIESLTDIKNTNNPNQITDIIKLVNMLFNEIYDYAKNNYEVPRDKMGFFINLLGVNNIQNETLFILHSILTKSSDILIKMYSNPLFVILKMLRDLKERFLMIENIYNKTRKVKARKK